MGDICAVEWIYWSGNQRRRDKAFFKNKKAAENFVKGMEKEKNIQSVNLIEGLTLADVRAESDV